MFWEAGCTAKGLAEIHLEKTEGGNCLVDSDIYTWHFFSEIKNLKQKNRSNIIGINVICEVPFYFVCICQKCHIISV